ncbi:hypothetical protein GN958_ATG23507 [Phytophthora infestans]|uniref:Uncharacterized protein n=1 Tax=Phytophthora infestans TaxID=4787 RepID=A0A8S9THU4_PHYIN|nr:hypothetical protein GN958_ATG23507 [Phytophthora infestans]
MGGSHIVVGHHLLLGQTQLVTEAVQVHIRRCLSSLGSLQIPLEVVDLGLELVDLRSGECHLPEEMVVVISHNVSLTGGAIQSSGQVADLYRLISQQESQVLRPRGRTVLPPLDLHRLVMDLGSQGLELGGVQRRSLVLGILSRLELRRQGLHLIGKSLG